MTAPKGKTSKPTATKPSDIVKANIARQRRRSEGTRESEFFESSRKAEVFATYQRFKKSGFPITVAELTRLAMARRKVESLSEITDSDLDDLLQFIARCQWRIEATKHFWDGYGAAFYDEDREEPEPTEVVKRIREEGEPISFERSLVLLGIPDRSNRKGESASEARTRMFYPIFSEWYIGASKISHVYGDVKGDVSFGSARPVNSWIEPTEKEISAAYKKRIEEGWPDGHVLEILSRFVEAWRKKSRTEANRENAKRRTQKRKD
jgi:uncharacterized protein YjiS (DUF1127 family)